MSGSQKPLVTQEPLPLSAIAFRRYLEQHQLEPLDVAIRSGVRYMTVWRLGKGNLSIVSMNY